MELRLASAYSEAKAAALNDVLEELFFDDGTLWTAAPLPAGVRDITHALAATMVRRISIYPPGPRLIWHDVLGAHKASCIRSLHLP